MTENGKGITKVNQLKNYALLALKKYYLHVQNRVDFLIMERDVFSQKMTI